MNPLFRRRSAASLLSSLFAAYPLCANAAPPDPKPDSVTIAESDGTELLQKDAGLRRTLELFAKGVTVRDLCAALTKSSGVMLRADEAIGERRVTLMTKSQTLAQTLTATAQILHFTWKTQKAPDGMTIYVLFQTPEQKAKEDALIAASEKREKKVYAEYEGKMTAQIAQRLNEPSDAPTVGGLISLLSADQRKQLATLSAQPLGIISASSGAVFHGQLVGARPYRELPESAQKLLRDTLKQPGYAATAEESYTHPVNAESEWTKTQFGFVAMGGQVCPAVVTPDGSDIWWYSAGKDVISVPGIPDELILNDFDPTVTERLDQDNLVNLTGLPDAPRQKPLRFQFKMQVRGPYLADALEQMCRQTGAAFATADYWRSRTAPAIAAGVYLRRPEPYTLRDALKETARVFACRIRYQGGFVRLESLTPGGDLRAEPPAKLLNMLRQRAETKTPLEFPDYLAIAALSRLQFETFLLKPPKDRPPLDPLLLQTLYRPLHLYTLLTAEQQSAAETAEGLSFADAEKPLKQAFLSVAGIGMPKTTEAGRSLEPNRLYVIRTEKEGGLERLRFILTSPAKPVSVAVYDLPLTHP